MVVLTVPVGSHGSSLPGVTPGVNQRCHIPPFLRRRPEGAPSTPSWTPPPPKMETPRAPDHALVVLFEALLSITSSFESLLLILEPSPSSTFWSYGLQEFTIRFTVCHSYLLPRSGNVHHIEPILCAPIVFCQPRFVNATRHQCNVPRL